MNVTMFKVLHFVQMEASDQHHVEYHDYKIMAFVCVGYIDVL